MSDDAIGFGEQVLALLDQGRFTATYKFAVLLALLDACLEGVDAEGRAPTAVHPTTLATRVVELYWPHTTPYSDPTGDEALVLRQNRGGQAEIVSLVRRFREATDPSGRAPLARARHLDPAGYRQLIADVTWKLAQMPLPRLQRFGKAEVRFLYDLDWDEQISRRRFEGGEVDPVLHLRPGVGEHLVRLAGLLRPLIQRQWTQQVVDLNRTQVTALAEQGDLDDFLFGASRIALEPVRGDLRDLQDGDCFYCRDRLGRSADVDHFLPWSRHPDDGIHNLVAAHPACNNRKRDFLAADEHVESWSERFRRRDLRAALDGIAAARRWGSQPERTLSVARAVYLRLPEGAQLWRLGDEFAPPVRARLEAALAPSVSTGGRAGSVAAEAPQRFDPGGQP
jgi:5-methylcytosine-specific restriction endonuclease McrA